MGKTFSKNRGFEDEYNHTKNASRHGHSAKYKKQLKEKTYHPIPETVVRGMNPLDFLSNEDFVNGLDYDD